MYENEVNENVAVDSSEELPDDISLDGRDILDSNDLNGISRNSSLREPGEDVSADAGSEQLGESVSSGDGVSDVGISYSVSDSTYCSCSCGDSAPDLSTLECQADKISGLVLIIFLFLILSWTENKLRLALSAFRERRR